MSLTSHPTTTTPHPSPRQTRPTPTPTTAASTPSQAWAILHRHAREEITPLRLQELCNDTDRVSSLVAVHTTEFENKSRILVADISRQRMTLDTLNHLMRLANARDVVRGFVRSLAWGENDPENPVIAERGGSVRVVQAQMLRSASGSGLGRRMMGRDGFGMSMHLALRAPDGEGMEMLAGDGSNVLDGIHREWRRIQRLAEGLRGGQVRGAGGAVITDVIVVGRGVAVMALRFMYEALRRDEEAERATREGMFKATSGEQKGGGGKQHGGPCRRQMRFVSSVDPVAAASAIADLRPESSIVISIALQGNEETSLATNTLRNWLVRGLAGATGKRPDVIASKHMILITASERLKANKPENVFLIPEHSRCEAFTTFTAAGLLPLSIVFGWNIVRKILSGAHNMDTHFVETNPRHNLPIILALTDVWNDAFLLSSGRLVTPFSEPFSAFPAFVAAIESQTCARPIDPNGNITATRAAVVIDGGMNGAYDRMLYQGSKIIPSELITAMDTQAKIGMDGEEVQNHDALICSFFAHADVLAFGSAGGRASGSTGATIREGGGMIRTESGIGAAMGGGNGSIHDLDFTEGNRPSTLLLCGRCDAFTCGQLVALSEHRAVVAARLWDVDPFEKKVGSSLRAAETERLREKLQRIYDRGASSNTSNFQESDDETDVGVCGKVNLATTTILGHYAKRMQDLKYVVKSP